MNLHLTNVSMVPVEVSRSLLHYRRWRIVRRQQEGDIEVSPNRNSHFGIVPVQPGRMAEAIGSWLLPAPFQKAEEPIQVRVELVDQFGERSWSDWITVYAAGDSRRLY